MKSPCKTTREEPTLNANERKPALSNEDPTQPRKERNAIQKPFCRNRSGGHTGARWLVINGLEWQLGAMRGSVCLDLESRWESVNLS